MAFVTSFNFYWSCNCCVYFKSCSTYAIYFNIFEIFWM